MTIFLTLILLALMAGVVFSLVKGIIEGHGGRIWVTSAPGRGTTVSFTLPLSQPGGG